MSTDTAPPDDWPAIAGPAPAAETPRDLGTLIAVVPRSCGRQLRITLNEFRGRPMVGLRLWGFNASDEFVPFRQGLNLKLEEVNAVITAIEAAAEMARAVEEE